MTAFKKDLFKVVNDLTAKRNAKTLPTNISKNDLPSTFNTFFIEKIDKIREILDKNNDCPIFSKFHGTVFEAFTPVNEEYVKKIILKCKKSFSELDPLPANLFYECLDVILPYITDIFNESLTTGVFPSNFKDSIVIPLIKKSNLDPNVLKNYRPVSNLSFISKVLERIVHSQILAHLTQNKLTETFQSAYKEKHSTEMPC
jgi:hypothetical protein